VSGVSSKKRHPIQVVARRTGLSADVLRAWEKRYGILAPARSEGGRRLYSDDDIEYLRLLKRATTAGRNVGQLVALPPTELAAMVREDEAAAALVPAGPAAGTLQHQRLDQAIAAVRGLDAVSLEGVLRRAVIELEAAEFLEHLAVPLLIQIGELWLAAALRPAHEHMASTVIRGVLGLMTTFDHAEAAPRGVFATPSGQRHEFGAMLAAATAAAQGWHVTYLGADLPAEDIAASAQQIGAAMVGLSLLYPVEDPTIPKELRALRKLLPSDVVLIVGGAAATHYRKALADIDALVVSDLGQLRSTLKALATGAVPR
jgi:DNA-binding transcriptional MerR regulator/methylmalonyl-CoA mutase cobalamin-binding subunit